MSPLPENFADHALWRRRTYVTKPTDADGLILEAWAQGYMVGSLIILSCITLANMRRGVLLHKLIMLELVLGYWQGFFIFFHQPIYAWWLSVAAIPLNMSWSLHNVIAWMKIKPFMTRPASLIFIGTVILVQPYWVVEIYANFTYFHNVNDIFLKTRPWEALCRDPWWVVTTVYLFYSITTKYDLSLRQIIQISPRFAVMLGAMLLSIAFIILDVLSVTSVLKGSLPIGINPFWKLSFVFKCLTDAVVLDDFKTALDRLRAFKMSRLGSFAVDGIDSRSKEHQESVLRGNAWTDPPAATAPVRSELPISSPDGDYVQPRLEELKGGRSNHVEGIPRNASKDRASEESFQGEANGIDLEPMRGASDSHILGPQESSPEEESTSGMDLQEDYAQAMRQIASNMANGGPRRHPG